jgi:hypothetical protein
LLLLEPADSCLYISTIGGVRRCAQIGAQLIGGVVGTLQSLERRVHVEQERRPRHKEVGLLEEPMSLGKMLLLELRLALFEQAPRSGSLRLVSAGRVAQRKERQHEQQPA